jgi:GLTT repeat (6 copies)
LGGGGVGELGDPVEDEPPDPVVDPGLVAPGLAAPGLAAPGVAALGLAAAGLVALLLVLVDGRAAKALVPLLQPQPQNARASRKNRARRDSEF